MELVLPITAINNAAIVDALAICFLFDFVTFLITSIGYSSMNRTIKRQQNKVKELHLRAGKLKEKGITKVFVEYAKLEREIIKEDKELTILQNAQKERTDSCDRISTKITYVQYVLIFLLFYFISRPLATIGDGDNNSILRGFFFPMSFKPVVVGSLFLPTGSLGALAVMLASKVVVKRVLKIVS